MIGKRSWRKEQTQCMEVEARALSETHDLEELVRRLLADTPRRGGMSGTVFTRVRWVHVLALRLKTKGHMWGVVFCREPGQRRA